jgi:hypothetical protein
MMVGTMNLSIAKEFSVTPGPRSKADGEFSGEEFLEKLLIPKFREAEDAGETLAVDLDGTEGYATSFLEAAFGELARRFGKEKVQKILVFKSDDEPFLIGEIQRYIEEAHLQ